MSFAKLKTARQAKQSYVTPPTLQPSPESSAVPSQAVAEPTVTNENLYKCVPEYLEIRTSPTSGRGLWTTKSCSPGQVIFAVKPHAAALSTERLDLHCSQCFGDGDTTTLKRCTKCQAVYYCDSTCQNADWSLHKNECAAIQRIAAAGETSLPSDAIRCLGRIMCKRQKQGPSSVWTREIDALQSHNKDIEPAAYELHTHLAISLVRYLGLSFPSELASFGLASGADLANFVSRFVTNTFTITDPSLTPLGACVSPPVALLNHSCDPNAVVVFPHLREPLMHVVALREIAPGEEILTAYIDTTLPRAQRQTALRATYHFVCACSLCAASPGVDVVDPREAVWCPRACGGMCPAPSEENSLSRCAACGAVLQKTDEVLDAVRVGQEALDKATKLQFVDPAKAHRLTTNLLPILASAGLPPSSHPRLALARLHTALLIAGIAESQASSSPPLSTTPSTSTPASALASSSTSTQLGPQPANPIPQLQTPTQAQETLDSAILAATHVCAGLDAVLRAGHPMRGIARAELGKLLAVDEPAPRAQAASYPSSAAAVSSPPSASTPAAAAQQTGAQQAAQAAAQQAAAEESLRYPPSGPARLRLALDTLLHARAELSVGFGAANEGGAVGRAVREDIVRLERELGVWRKGVGEALRDARDAGRA
ncbi:hypothetical protein C8R47DRAFT_1280715 [Mycena vitilis]|nr:hypothetical protein C8R47DRAFT_1280715 [Mycena vitilis]